MGADLYIQSVHESQQEEYQPELKWHLGIRDAAKRRGDQRTADLAQKQVNKFYDLMHAEGYFRDSYNPSNLLNLFDLSYWTDFDDRLDSKSNLQSTDAQWLLDELETRMPIFESKLVQMENDGGSFEDADTYFRSKLENFQAFLRKSVELNESIYCSI